MNAPDQDMFQQHIQLLGRTMVTLLHQYLHQKATYGNNNERTEALIRPIHEAVGETFRCLPSPSLRLTRHEIFLGGERIYIDSGFAESVAFLAEKLHAARLGGFIFTDAAKNEATLARGLDALHTTIAAGVAKGPKSIATALAKQGLKFIEPLPLPPAEGKTVSFTTPEDGKEGALRAALKLRVYLEQSKRALEANEPLITRPLYRLCVDLFRAQKTSPRALASLLMLPHSAGDTRHAFFVSLLYCLILPRLELTAETRLQTAVDGALMALLHNTRVPNQRTDPSRQRVAMAARSLPACLHSAKRLALVYYADLPAAEAANFAAVRVFRTLSAFVELWQDTDNELCYQSCLFHMLQAKEQAYCRVTLGLVGRALSLLAPGQTLVVDEQRLVWALAEDLHVNGDIHLHSVQRPEERQTWHLSGRGIREQQLERLKAAPVCEQSPNPTNFLFPRFAFHRH